MLRCVVAAEVIFEMMILAQVIDGTVTERGLALLKEAREVMEPHVWMESWPDSLSNADRQLYIDTLDTHIEHCIESWAEVIRDGGSSFVSNVASLRRRAIYL
jgi:hypothetical protein|eukprot:COSAG06_NODE_3906_length_4787_cov_1.683660_2_plen_102_part_00